MPFRYVTFTPWMLAIPDLPKNEVSDSEAGDCCGGFDRLPRRISKSIEGMPLVYGTFWSVFYLNQKGQSYSNS